MANKRSPKKTAPSQGGITPPGSRPSEISSFEKPEFARRSTQIGGARICLMIGMRMTGYTSITAFQSSLQRDFMEVWPTMQELSVNAAATGDRGSCSDDVFESLAAMQLSARALLFAQDDDRVYSRGPQSWKRACRSRDQEQCRY